MKNKVGRPKLALKPAIAAHKRLNPKGWDGKKKNRATASTSEINTLPIGREQNTYGSN
ncbi:hypothetical protein [Bdellovibrio bacteriovorus]|uniref:hypothetical protein n=1 Tax=Bdellovibrio bacteriovorus TaxID=959 RepID=UPI000A84B9E2|nr:hypothetical protein [Bdellovibrio bacteriovorus]